jgi:hypothetical protein
VELGRAFNGKQFRYQCENCRSSSSPWINRVLIAVACITEALSNEQTRLNKLKIRILTEESQKLGLYVLNQGKMNN